MKTTFLTAAAALCIAGAGSLEAQTSSQPDSIRVQIVKNINGNEQAIDTVVPYAQQQSLMNWLSSEGIEMTIPDIPGDTLMKKMIMISMDGDSIHLNSSIPPIPPMPQTGNMKQMTVISDENSDIQIISLPPAVPQLPGAPPAPPAVPPLPAKGENMKVIVMRDSTGKETVVHKQVIILDSKDENMQQSPAPVQRKAGSESNEINVYPNPTEGHITLSFHLEGTGKTNIRITDMNGKIVYEEQLGEAYSAPYSKEITLSSGKGMYTIQVSKGENVLVRKVMVQ